MTLRVYNAAGEEKVNEPGYAPQGVVFSATKAAAMAAASGWRKITLDTEQFDPFGWFDAANSRFLPRIPGYYRISANLYWSSADTGAKGVGIYKNGALWHEAAEGTQPYLQPCSTLVYLNGTTDYVELWGWSANSIAPQGQGGGMYTAMQGELVASSVGVAPEPWHTIGAAGEPGYQNGWTTLTGNNVPAAFFKDPNGLVHIRGLITSGTAAAAFTLPAGYRPYRDGYRNVVSTNSGADRADVNTDGTVIPQTSKAGGGWFDLSGIAPFRGEA